MKSIYLKTGKTQEVFNDLKENFNATLTLNNGEYNLALQSDFAKGFIKGVSFSESMTYIQFNMVFTEEVILSMELPTNSPVFFIYCSEGTIQHSYGIQGDKKCLKKNHTGIIKSSPSINSIVYFPKNTPIRFSVIGVGSDIIYNKDNAFLFDKLKKTYVAKKENHMDISAQHSIITERIKELETTNQATFDAKLLKKQIIENILKIEIEQQENGFTELIASINAYSIKCQDTVKVVSHYVVNLPDRLEAILYTIKAELFSIKIQDLFKQMLNRTIHNLLILKKIENHRI